MKRAEWFVEGIPAPQGSKRHVGNGRMIESSKKVKPWRAAITRRVKPLPLGPITGPVAVELVFYLPRPKSHYRTGANAGVLRDNAPFLPQSRPDIDKLTRSTLDGIGETGLWADDSQVVELRASKHYADGFTAPGALITLTTPWEN